MNEIKATIFFAENISSTTVLISTHAVVMVYPNKKHHKQPALGFFSVP